MKARGIMMSLVWGCAMVHAQPPAGNEELPEEVKLAIEKFNAARGNAAPAEPTPPPQEVKPTKPMTAAEKAKAAAKAKAEAAEKAKAEAARVEAEKKQKAEEEKARIEAEKKQKADAEKAKADAEKLKTDAANAKPDAEKSNLEADKAKSVGGGENAKPTSDVTTEGAVKIEGDPKVVAKVAMEEHREPEEALKIKVEKLQTGSGEIDAKNVKLSAPFPAKPLSAAPVGWQLESPSTTPPFQRTVELAPGASITLSIRPHVLVPTIDGMSTFSIPEPGYDAAKGYQQSTTVGAVLSSSIQKLDEDAKNLGYSIDLLQQLLSSLPLPATEVAPPGETPEAEVVKPVGSGGKPNTRGRIK